MRIISAADSTFSVRHHAGWDPARGEWLYDIDSDMYPYRDRPPSSQVSEHNSPNPIAELKWMPYEEFGKNPIPADDLPDREYRWEEPAKMSGHPVCQRCLDIMLHNGPYGPEAPIHHDPNGHEYQPMTGYAPGASGKMET